jgi:hypothetical protein
MDVHRAGSIEYVGAEINPGYTKAKPGFWQKPGLFVASSALI